jgi:hypothetical protein
MIQERFYRSLGGFLYALALADGRIQPHETAELEKAVTKILRGHCGKLSPGGEVLLARLHFERCRRERSGASEAGRAFLELLEKHGAQIPEPDKQAAAYLVRRLADAFGGRRGRENEMEARVQERLSASAAGR